MLCGGASWCARCCMVVLQWACSGAPVRSTLGPTTDKRTNIQPFGYPLPLQCHLIASYIHCNAHDINTLAHTRGKTCGTECLSMPTRSRPEGGTGEVPRRRRSKGSRIFGPNIPPVAADLGFEPRTFALTERRSTAGANQHRTPYSRVAQATREGGVGHRGEGGGRGR